MTSERCYVVGSIPASYSGGSRFKCQSRHPPARQTLCVLLLRPSGQIPEYYLKSYQTFFPPNDLLAAARFQLLTALLYTVIKCQYNYVSCWKCAYPDDGNSRLLRKVGIVLPDYKASHSKRQLNL
jgi:hypothetical protein